MKAFKNGAEIRLTKKDLMEALDYVINNRLLGVCMDEHSVTDIQLSPQNKYVARITISPLTTTIAS